MLGDYKAKYVTDVAELVAMDEVEFRARFRERCHHTMEIQVYSAAYSGRKLPETQAKVAKIYLEAWDKRGLSKDLPDYKYVEKLLEYCEALMKGEKVSFDAYAPSPLTEADVKSFDKVLYERRSVREWTDERVPDELLEKVIKAGNWAAHGCNLQSMRYGIIREEDAPNLFRGSDIPGGPVHIVICQDYRSYINYPPTFHNVLLDCGAAAQNIVLAAHAYGLGGCWLTYTSNEMKERVEKHMGLEPDVHFITYVDVGFPDQTPMPPLRMGTDETIIYKSSI